MSDKYAQFLPPEETQELKPKSPAEQVKDVGNRFTEWKNKVRDNWRGFSDFTKSVWDNPYEFDVTWHKQNAERLRRGRGGHKLNWLQWAKLSPALRSLYYNVRR